MLKYNGKWVNYMQKKELMDNFKLYNRVTMPDWNSLPDIELYMDQVIFLLNQYLKDILPVPVTQSMINNYVKQKAIPAPVKKRYSKLHLAYLIIFCTLKQTLSIATIKKLFPSDISFEEMKEIYSRFLNNKTESSKYSKKLMSEISNSLDDTSDIVVQISNISNVFKLTVDKIMENNKTTLEEEK